MDPIQFVWLMGFGTLIGGGILGAIAYRNLNPASKDASNLKAELDQVKKEMESYKANVNSHFDKTSELVNELTQDYVKVYKHLAEGAQELGDGREFAHVLEQHQGKILISVESEPSVQDNIVSEVKTDSQEPRQAGGEPLDFAVTQESTSGVGAVDIAADLKVEQSADAAELGEDSGGDTTKQSVGYVKQ